MFSLKGGGWLTLQEEGMRVRLEAVRPNDGRGLYKVWLRGDGGSLLLGTLAPEREGLSLRRLISRSEMERSGCWPVTGGETMLVFPFGSSSWQREECPERQVKDIVLGRALKGKTMLVRQRRDGFCLAAPYDPGRPFLLSALFCLSRVEQVNGKSYAVFYFDGEGNPIMPHKEGDPGENSEVS